MSHPYEKYENTRLWESVEEAVNKLVENKDVELKTRVEYVVGYLCKSISTEINTDDK